MERTGEGSGAVKRFLGGAVSALLLLLFAAFPASTQPCEEARPLVELLTKAYPNFTGEAVCAANGAILFKPGGTEVLLPLRAAPGEAERPGAYAFASTLAQGYPAGEGARYPAAGFAPGRLRSLPLLRALYGADEREARANCVMVDFCGTTLPFNRRHGAAEALSRVSARLNAHFETHPEDRGYVLPCAGGFMWRTVKDTGLLSAHAFGIAIDLNPRRGPYHLWSNTERKIETARQGYPQAVIDAFEAEGFIWGGKWDAFDLMHFEYRPEFFPARDAMVTASPR